MSDKSVHDLELQMAQMRLEQMQRATGKSKIVAFFFAWFLGGLGIHRFYLNRPLSGIFYLLFFWTLIPALIAFFEGIIFLCTSDDEFNMKYN